MNQCFCSRQHSSDEVIKFVREQDWSVHKFIGAASKSKKGSEVQQYAYGEGPRRHLYDEISYKCSGCDYRLICLLEPWSIRTYEGKERI